MTTANEAHVFPVGRTQRGHNILEWRDTGKTDRWGEPEQEARIEGFGWCRYSWRLSAILIDGKWFTY